MPQAVRIAGVTVTTPERVLYPALGFTKRDVIELYAEIGAWALPHLAGRPLTLVRCEHGASAADALRSECRFLPHSAGWHRWVPPFVRRVHITEQRKLGEYLVIDSLQALLAVLNGDILELHSWSSHAERVELPDRLVFDLDPGPDVRWAQLVAAARTVATRLDALGLQCWVKSTGGKGLHVVVPIEPELEWDACYAFAKAFAVSTARATPGLTATFAKQARRGVVLIDYKRNVRTSISVAAFSPRARPDGTLAVPLPWEQLDPRRPLSPYTVQNARARIARWRADPWAEYWRARQSLRHAAGALLAGR